MGVSWRCGDVIAQECPGRPLRAVLRHEKTHAGILAWVFAFIGHKWSTYALSANSRRCTPISSGVVA